MQACYLGDGFERPVHCVHVRAPVRCIVILSLEVPASVSLYIKQLMNMHVIMAEVEQTSANVFCAKELEGSMWCLDVTWHAWLQY